MVYSLARNNPCHSAALETMLLSAANKLYVGNPDVLEAGTGEMYEEVPEPIKEIIVNRDRYSLSPQHVLRELRRFNPKLVAKPPRFARAVVFTNYRRNAEGFEKVLELNERLCGLTDTDKNQGADSLNTVKYEQKNAYSNEFCELRAQRISELLLSESENQMTQGFELLKAFGDIRIFNKCENALLNSIFNRTSKYNIRLILKTLDRLISMDPDNSDIKLYKVKLVNLILEKSMKYSMPELPWFLEKHFQLSSDPDFLRIFNNISGLLQYRYMSTLSKSWQADRMMGLLERGVFSEQYPLSSNGLAAIIDNLVTIPDKRILRKIILLCNRILRTLDEVPKADAERKSSVLSGILGGLKDSQFILDPRMQPFIVNVLERLSSITALIPCILILIATPLNEKYIESIQSLRQKFSYELLVASKIVEEEEGLKEIALFNFSMHAEPDDDEQEFNQDRYSKNLAKKGVCSHVVYILDEYLNA